MDNRTQGGLKISQQLSEHVYGSESVVLINLGRELSGKWRSFVTAGSSGNLGMPQMFWQVGEMSAEEKSNLYGSRSAGLKKVGGYVVIQLVCSICSII